MKRVFFFSLFFLMAVVAGAQGKYAGAFKKLVGTVYTNTVGSIIPGLEKYEFRQGSVASELSDPEIFLVDIYQKGTTYISFFSIEEDSVLRTQRILDVVEIKGMKPGWEIKTAVCRVNKTPDAFIVALVKPGNAEYSTNVKKAWRFNRDKRRFEIISVKEIDCLHEGFDLTMHSTNSHTN